MKSNGSEREVGKGDRTGLTAVVTRAPFLAACWETPRGFGLRIPGSILVSSLLFTLRFAILVGGALKELATSHVVDQPVESRNSESLTLADPVIN